MSNDTLRLVIAICLIMLVFNAFEGLAIYNKSQLTDEQKMQLAESERIKEIEKEKSRAELKRFLKQQADHRSSLQSRSFFDVAYEQRANWILGYLEANPNLFILTFLFLAGSIILLLRAKMNL